MNESSPLLWPPPACPVRIGVEERRDGEGSEKVKLGDGNRPGEGCAVSRLEDGRKRGERRGSGWLKTGEGEAPGMLLLRLALPPPLAARLPPLLPRMAGVWRNEDSECSCGDSRPLRPARPDGVAAAGSRGDDEEDSSNCA